MTSRGRPPREPAPAERTRVEEFVAEGASQRVIAVALGRSVPNLRKFFAAELGCEKKSGPELPPFKITARMREDASLMAACCEPRARIARALAVSEENLEAFFAEELEIGAARYRLKTLRRLEALAEVGNLGATKQLAAYTSAPSGEKPLGYVSKKATARDAAAGVAAAGGKYAPPPPPRLVIDNR